MADTDPGYVSQGAFRRLVNAAKRVEKMPQNERGRGRRWPPGDDGGGDGGPQRVHFSIDSYDSGTGIAICTVEYRPFGVGVVYGEVDGKVDVEDPAGCYFNEEEYDLVGRWGHADYMTQNGDSYSEGVWVVSGLCCPEA